MARLIDDLLVAVAHRAQRAPAARHAGRPGRRSSARWSTACRRWRATAASRSDSRRPRRPLIVPGDRDELIRVFENLVENALKYGAAGKRVEIALTLGAVGGRRAGSAGRGARLRPGHRGRAPAAADRALLPGRRHRERRGVGRVGEHSQPRQHVAHLGPLEEGGVPAKRNGIDRSSSAAAASLASRQPEPTITQTASGLASPAASRCSISRAVVWVSARSPRQRQKLTSAESLGSPEYLRREPRLRLRSRRVRAPAWRQAPPHLPRLRPSRAHPLCGRARVPLRPNRATRAWWLAGAWPSAASPAGWGSGGARHLPSSATWSQLRTFCLARRLLALACELGHGGGGVGDLGGQAGRGSEGRLFGVGMEAQGPSGRVTDGDRGGADRLIGVGRASDVAVLGASDSYSAR